MKNLNELKTEHSELATELRGQIAEKDRILDEYKKSHGKLEDFFAKVSANIKPVLPLTSVYEKGSGKVGSPCVAVMRISDGHMGSVQLPDEIEGFNEFNPDICRSRQMDYAYRFCKWVDITRGAYQIDEVAVIVTGDLISGDIHDELRVTNAFPTPVQCVRAAEVLVEQMRVVSSNFSQVTVHFLVEDNHARLTKKPQAKEAGYNSFNYVVGKIAEIYLSTIDNVTFNIYPQYEKVITVLNRNYLIAHGHGIKGWMGIPWYSIERHVGKEAKARLQIIMDDKSKAAEVGFHKFVFGHYHSYFETDMYSCCPSVSGTDAYDHKSGRHSEPGQSAWIVHEKLKEINHNNFRL